MSYTLYKPTGANGTNPVSVADGSVNATSWYDSTNKLGVQLVGRNAVDYGTAVAQNTLQMVSNFAGTALPNDTIALQGQLWFNATSTSTGKLLVRVTSNTSGTTANWRQLAVIADPGDVTGTDGQIKVNGSVISIWANGAWQQVFPAVYS